MKKSYPLSIGSYIPQTFVVDFRQEQSQVEDNLQEFIRYYFTKDSARRPRNKPVNIKNYFVDIAFSPKKLNKLMEYSETAIYQRSKGELELAEEQPLWILKPTALNRGRGIHVFSTLKQLSKLLS